MYFKRLSFQNNMFKFDFFRTYFIFICIFNLIMELTLEGEKLFLIANRAPVAPRPIINPPTIYPAPESIIPNRFFLRPSTTTTPTRYLLPKTPAIFFPNVIPNRFTIKPVIKTFPTNGAVFALPSTTSLTSTALPVPKIGSIDLNKTSNLGTKTTDSSSNQFVVKGLSSPNLGTLLPGNNSTNSSITQFLSRLCTNPGFCSNGVYDDCSHQPLTECERCDLGLASVFIFFVVLLGLAILFGNLIITLVSYHRYKARKMDKFDICKTSLALADMLTGKKLTV